MSTSESNNYRFRGNLPRTADSIQTASVNPNPACSSRGALICTAILSALLAVAVSTMVAASNISPVEPLPKSSKGPLKIGFIASPNGLAADISKDMINGINLYLDQIHSQMAGRHVELIIENDQSDAGMAVAKIHELVDKHKVQVLDGGIIANTTYKIAPFVEQLRVPMILPVTTADNLTKRERFNWIVRTSEAGSQPAHPFGEWVYKNLGYKRVAIFGLNFPLGWEAAAGFQRTFEEAGGKIVQKLWAPMGCMDYSPYIKALSKNADAVYLAFGAFSRVDTIPRIYSELGPKVPLLACGSALDESPLRNMGDEIIGAMSAEVYSAALDTQPNKRFVKAYRQKYGQDPSRAAEGSYVSGMWIQKAAEAVGGNVEDKPRFLAALKKVVLLDAPRGPLKLDDHGNPIENVYVRRVEKVNGKLQNTVIYTFPNVSQFWKYNPQEFLKQPAYSREYPVCKYCGDEGSK